MMEGRHQVAEPTKSGDAGFGSRDRYMQSLERVASRRE